MSFGYSVSDCMAVGALAWKVYKSCRDAPDSFGNISTEVLSMHAVLKEVEEVLSDEPLSPSRGNNLATITRGCEGVLQELDALVKKYESLGTSGKRTWDRMKWGFNDIADLRARLTSHVMMMTAFMSTSQIVVGKKLNKLVQEFQEGKHEGSVLSVVTVESLSLDEKETWRAIRKALEDIGISVAAFDANKEFILQWFQTTIEDGAFDEISSATDQESTHSGTVSHDSLILRGDVLGSSKLGSLESTASTASPTSLPIMFGNIAQVEVQSDSRNDDVVCLTTKDPSTKTDAPKSSEKSKLGTKTQKKPLPMKHRPIVIRIQRFLGFDPDPRFRAACAEGDLHLARELLNRGANVNGGDQTPFMAIESAVRAGHYGTVKWLLEQGSRPVGLSLALRNVGIYPRAKRLGIVKLLVAKNILTPAHLTQAIWTGELKCVKWIVEKGGRTVTKINGNPIYVAAGINDFQFCFESESILEYLLDQGIDINWGTKSALINALEHSCDRNAQILIERGADIFVKSPFSAFTTIMIAAKQQCSGTLKLLLEQERYPNINHRDFYGKTALDLVWRGSTRAPAIIKLLVSKGAKSGLESIKEAA